MICQVAPMNIKTCLLLMVFTLGVSVAIPHLDDRIVPEVSEVEVQENTVGPITYYQGNAGTTCPPGQLITSQAECLNTAVNSLDVQAGSAWVGSALSIPVGCSIRRAGAANHNDFAPHWNRSPSGVGRADLNPICAGGVFECPDGISSKGVFFPYAIAAWSNPWSCPQPSCHKWDSLTILTNHLTCDESRMASEGVYTCTKATATHVHWATRASGMMIMKRIRCTRSADGHDDCATFKVGICLDVGSNVFNHKHTGDITDMKTQIKAWLAKA